LDDAKTPNAKIGEYSTITRKKGKYWWVRTLNAVEHRNMQVKIDFLKENRMYDTIINSDAFSDGGDRTKVSIENNEFKKNYVISFEVEKMLDTL
jgi:hypothetical protein